MPCLYQKLKDTSHNLEFAVNFKNLSSQDIFEILVEGLPTNLHTFIKVDRSGLINCFSCVGQEHSKKSEDKYRSLG